MRGAACASLLGVLALAGVTACGDETPADAGAPHLDRDTLMDPATCAGCHPKQYEQWAGSMHAYAADDPLFLAMNARGQRTAELGKFCVNCHAPLAVRTGATEDGLNLAELDPKLRGVTCYFCHTVESVTGTHDNPLVLASDDVFRGEYDDPVANTAHGSRGSKLHDRDRLESAALCGACHDIVNGHGVHLERSFEEWQGTVFSQAEVGTSCGQCHMPQSKNLEPAADAPNVFARRTHDHRFPAVDAPLTPTPDRDVLVEANQALLDTTLQSALCVRGAGELTELRVILDNVAAGHAFPSGAAQDRRLWVELTAYAGDEVVYRSGAVPEGSSVTELDDPDAWAIYDCLFGEGGERVHMFWEAREYESNLLPGQVTFDASDPRYYQSHVLQKYPRGDGFLAVTPDRVEMTLKLLPFGLDVFDELVASGDLVDTDAFKVNELRDALEPYTLGTTLTWTAAAAGETFVVDGLPTSCVTNTSLNYRAQTTPAVNHARCVP